MFHNYELFRKNLQGPHKNIPKDQVISLIECEETTLHKLLSHKINIIFEELLYTFILVNRFPTTTNRFPSISKKIIF